MLKYTDKINTSSHLFVHIFTIIPQNPFLYHDLRNGLMYTTFRRSENIYILILQEPHLKPLSPTLRAFHAATLRRLNDEPMVEKLIATDSSERRSTSAYTKQTNSVERELPRHERGEKLRQPAVGTHSLLPEP